MAHLLLPALDINVTLTPSLANFDLPSETPLESSSQKINTFFYAFQGIFFLVYGFSPFQGLPKRKMTTNFFWALGSI